MQKARAAVAAKKSIICTDWGDVMKKVLYVLSFCLYPIVLVLILAFSFATATVIFNEEQWYVYIACYVFTCLVLGCHYLFIARTEAKPHIIPHICLLGSDLIYYTSLMFLFYEYLVIEVMFVLILCIRLYYTVKQWRRYQASKQIEN